MKAVARKLDGRDVATNSSLVCPLGEKVSEQIVDVLLSARELVVVVLVEQGGQIRVIVSARTVGEERERLEHGFEPVAGLRPLANLGELCEVAGDLTLVPREQHGLDVGKVPVKGGSADPRPLGDLRHRHAAEAVFSGQGGGGVEDGVAHLAAVGVDGLLPQPRHADSLCPARQLALP
jgi:hypothetical protein